MWVLGNKLGAHWQSELSYTLSHLSSLFFYFWDRICFVVWLYGPAWPGTLRVLPPSPECWDERHRRTSCAANFLFFTTLVLFVFCFLWSSFGFITKLRGKYSYFILSSLSTFVTPQSSCPLVLSVWCSSGWATLTQCCLQSSSLH